LHTYLFTLHTYLSTNIPFKGHFLRESGLDGFPPICFLHVFGKKTLG